MTHARSSWHQMSGSFGPRTLQRTSRLAALDRYSTIRLFFKQQHTATEKLKALSSWNLDGRVFFPPQPRRLTSARVFGAPRFSTKSFRPSVLTRTFATADKTPQKPFRNVEQKPSPPKDTNAHPPEASAMDAENNFPHARDHENYSRFFRKLAELVPHPHKPTRDDLLKVSTTFWQRLRVRFKWFTVRSFRKFNADDISAFISWFLVSQTLWILIGTYVSSYFNYFWGLLNILHPGPRSSPSCSRH